MKDTDVTRASRGISSRRCGTGGLERNPFGSLEGWVTIQGATGSDSVGVAWESEIFNDCGSPAP